MVINNNLPDEKIIELIDSSQLSYSGNSQGRNCDSVVIDPIPPQESQYTSNKILAHNIYNGQHVSDDDIINIQLLYNSNWSIEPDL